MANILNILKETFSVKNIEMALEMMMNSPTVVIVYGLCGLTIVGLLWLLCKVIKG